MRREAQPALADSVTLEVTLAADAEPGRRELRVETPRGYPILWRSTLATARIREQESEPVFEPQTSSKAGFACRHDETPSRCGRGQRQIIPRERTWFTTRRAVHPRSADRFRFEARQGQQLVIAAAARDSFLLPDAVPGWFQATLALYDAGEGRWLRRRLPVPSDPVLRFQVPEDGQYVVEIGRDLTAAVRICPIALPGESLHHEVFPLEARRGGDPGKTLRWNLPADTLTIDAQDMTPGLHPLRYARGR